MQSVRRKTTRTVHLFGILGLAFVMGCGQSGTVMHPVSGQLQVASGNASNLAGGYIEAVLESDPTVRAGGIIGPDGAFELKTLQNGAVLPGVPEGSYKMRVLPNDDDLPARRAAAKSLAPRFSKFETSKLTLRVPTTEPVTVQVSAR